MHQKLEYFNTLKRVLIHYANWLITSFVSHYLSNFCVKRRVLLRRFVVNDSWFLSEPLWNPSVSWALKLFLDEMKSHFSFYDSKKRKTAHWFWPFIHCCLVSTLWWWGFFVHESLFSCNNFKERGIVFCWFKLLIITLFRKKG